MKTDANTLNASPQSPPLRLCLSDNDWVLKLATFDLLTEGIKRLKIPLANIRVLGTCDAVLSSSRIEKTYGEPVVARVKKFLKTVQVIEDELIDDQEFLRLSTCGIDAGEAQLFACPSSPNCIVATDDKRAMRRLTDTHALTDVHARHVGRVVCVEQILVAIAEVKGYAYIDQRIRPYSWIDDKVLQAWAGGKGQEPKDALKVLRSHVEDLNASTRGLLLPL